MNDIFNNPQAMVSRLVQVLMGLRRINVMKASASTLGDSLDPEIGAKIERDEGITEDFIQESMELFQEHMSENRIMFMVAMTDGADLNVVDVNWLIIKTNKLSEMTLDEDGYGGDDLEMEALLVEIQAKMTQAKVAALVHVCNNEQFLSLTIAKHFVEPNIDTSEVTSEEQFIQAMEDFLNVDKVNVDVYISSVKPSESTQVLH